MPKHRQSDHQVTKQRYILFFCSFSSNSLILFLVRSTQTYIEFVQLKKKKTKRIFRMCFGVIPASAGGYSFQYSSGPCSIEDQMWVLACKSCVLALCHHEKMFAFFLHCCHVWGSYSSHGPEDHNVSAIWMTLCDVGWCWKLNLRVYALRQVLLLELLFQVPQLRFNLFLFLGEGLP